MPAEGARRVDKLAQAMRLAPIEDAAIDAYLAGGEDDLEDLMTWADILDQAAGSSSRRL